MRGLKWSFTGLAVSAALGSCGETDGNTAKLDAAVHADARPRDASIDAAPPPRVLYLNRAGGSFSRAAVHSDAISNALSWLDMARTYPAWPNDDTNWNNVTACITAGLAPFDVQITQTDPSPQEHHEIVFTTQLGFGSVYPMAMTQPNCDLAIRNSVGAVFGTAIGTDVALACAEAIAVFAIGSTGLDYSQDCRDYTGVFKQECGARMFLNQTVQCGAVVAQPCECGGTSQNSFTTMMSKYGPHP